MFESTFYVSKAMVMVIPKVVMGKQRQTSDPDTVYILFQSNKLDS